MVGLHIMSSTFFLFLMLGGLLWKGQFIWFPGGEALLGLFVHDTQLPTRADEVWAVNLYR